MIFNFMQSLVLVVSFVSLLLQQHVVSGWIAVSRSTSLPTTTRTYQPSLNSASLITARKKSLSSSSSSSSCLYMVQSLTLETLNDNHEEIGTEMANSIIRWLDNEWMPQTIHSLIAEQCKVTYIRLRTDGEDDLMSIMTAVADDLILNWHIYNKDAFVNAWDISNYVSDYLTSKTGIEGCECSTRIY